MKKDVKNETVINLLPKDYVPNLSDFAFFLSVMKNKAAYEAVLSLILDEADLKLKEAKVEEVVLNEKGKRAIRLDAWALDSKERQINTEMENDVTHDDVRKRSRYYQGLLDSPILKAGKKTRYKHLPITIIIFITQEDVFGKDLACYTFTEQCEEIAGLHLEDGTTKMFLNMSSRNGRPELISLLQYMKDTRVDNPEITVWDERMVTLNQIVEEVRQSEEWEAVNMSSMKIAWDIAWEAGMEAGREAGMEAGMEAGRKAGREEGIAVLIMDNLEEGIPTERILAKLVKGFELTEEQAENYLAKYAPKVVNSMGN